MLITGAVIVIGTESAVPGKMTKPGMVAVTVSGPAPSGSYSTPPAALVLGLRDCPAIMDTLTDGPVTDVVTSCAAAGLRFWIVATRVVPPALTVCSTASAVLAALGAPRRTKK